jgi:hypothetical protein
MSDDGFAGEAYSPYSDFEDLLYDADPGPDLADDLASHAIHSPVFADEPGYDILEYHSDWDYYSDDYFDDDPNLLKNNPQDGGPLKPQKVAKRGKKRKLADVEDIPELDLGERITLRDCIKGTVWARPAAEKDNIFRGGEEDKVSLLRDWRQRFGTTSEQQPGREKRPRLQEDESWANDMSLADMGLLNERGSRLHENEGGVDAGDEGEDGDYVDEDEGEDEPVENAGADVTGATLDGAAAATPEMEPIVPDQLATAPEVLPVQLKKQSQSTKDILPSPPTSNGSVATERDPKGSKVNENSPPSESGSRGRGRGRARTAAHTEVGDGSQGEATKVVNSQASEAKLKKRKASASPPPDSELNDSRTTRSIAGSRAKRVASTKITRASDGADKPPTATRSTRSKRRGG